jgi:hypothetical protein
MIRYSCTPLYKAKQPFFFPTVNAGQLKQNPEWSGQSQHLQLLLTDIPCPWGFNGKHSIGQTYTAQVK